MCTHAVCKNAVCISAVSTNAVCTSAARYLTAVCDVQDLIELQELLEANVVNFTILPT